MPDASVNTKAMLFLGEFDRRGIEASYIPSESLIHASYRGVEKALNPDNLLSLSRVPAGATNRGSETERMKFSRLISFQVIVANTGYIFVADERRGRAPVEILPEHKKACFEELDRSGMPLLGMTLNVSSPVHGNARSIVSTYPVASLADLPPSTARDLAGEIATILFPDSFADDACFPAVTVLDDSGFASVRDLNLAMQEKSRFSFRPCAVEVELTHRCNLLCDECAILDDVKRGEYGLPPEQILGFLREAEKFGIYAYSLTGGEPLLRFDDLCTIISESPLDCFKIQTNGTFYNNRMRGREIMERLTASGFGSRNRYVKASLSCSVGIQNSTEDSWKAAFGLAEDFHDLLDPDKAVLSFVHTQEPDEQPAAGYAAFRRGFECASRKFFDTRRIHVRPVPLQYAPALAEDHEKRFGKRKIGEMVDELQGAEGCFDTTKSSTPWPRLLLRATGDVYACSCFAHVLKLGNVKEDTLETMLQRADDNKLFAVLREGGLGALLKEAEKKDPEIASREVPCTLGRCGVCKLLWDEAKVTD